MIKKKLKIEGIPAILWGGESDKIQLIHGISQLPFFMVLKMTCVNMMS